MKMFVRTLTLLPLCASLGGCANAGWLPSFLQALPRLQQAVVLDDTPHIMPAAFVKSVPVDSPVIAMPKPVAVRKVKRSPAARVAAAHDAALQEPAADGYVNAIQVYPYSDGALYRLYAAPQEVSDIALQTGESLTAISAGDTTRWVVGDTTSGAGASRQVHVLAKPFAPGLTTNLVITTDRRSYHLELESTAKTFMTAISWTYPQDTLVKQAATPAASPMDGLASIENLHFDYFISGDTPIWKPIRAFDDGTHVYIEFPAAMSQGEAPPLFVAGPNGSRDLVNYRVRGTFYIVDQLFASAELRLGQEPQQVVRIKRASRLQAANSDQRQAR